MLSPSRGTYRAAIIGCGGRARAHMPGLKADDRIQIVALSDIRPESSESFASDFALNTRQYTDYKELLEAERPDVVVATLWTALHLPVIRECVRSGVKVILSEKPMAATWGECEEMARLAETSGVVLTFCHQRRFASGNRKVRELLGAGRFGKIERMDLFSPPHLLDCGTHSMDQALSFNSDVPVKWVHGAVDVTETVDFFNVPAEGMFTGMFYWENGVFGTIRTGTVNMDFWGGVRVTGSDGFVEAMWDGQIRRAVVYSEPGWKFPAPEEVPEEQMIGLVKNALDCLESGAEPELSYKKALRANEILFAFYASAERHERVTLPLTGVVGNPFHDMLASGLGKPKGETV
ncbi:MAG: Gfo/Idh/MocA family oxidoreductase [Akkermansiaceae bacterium]|nr:Gfo/Idh/MocA family oxidoreductase [Armatimonadota bacterium]